MIARIVETADRRRGASVERILSTSPVHSFHDRSHELA